MTIRFKKNSEISGLLTTKSVEKFGGRPVRGVFKNEELAREVKSIPMEFKQVGDRTIEGLFSVFGNVDSTYDVIEPGAFTKTIKDNSNRFRHLWQHEMDLPPIAVVDAVWEVPRDQLPKSVIEMTDGTAMGGAMVKRTYLNNDLANWVFEAIIQKALNEMSFAFDTIRWSYEDRDPDDEWSWPLRRIHELRHFESSDVNWGANDATVGHIKVVDESALPESKTNAEITPDVVFQVFKAVRDGNLKLEPGIFTACPELFEYAKRLDEKKTEQPEADRTPADPKIEDSKGTENPPKSEESPDESESLERMRVEYEKFMFEMEI